MTKKKINESKIQNSKLKEDGFCRDFFHRIGNGESLRRVSSDLGVPFQSVWSSIMSYEKNRIAYEDEKISRAHYHSAKIEEILNDLEKGRMEPKVARILIDARKWLAGKMYPKFFSDRIEIKHNMSIDVKKMHIEKLRRMTFMKNSCSNN